MYYNGLGEKIVHVNQTSKDPLFFVYNAGITYPNPEYNIIHNTDRFTRYDNYVFEYIVAGKGHIESGSIKRTVSAGDFVFQNKSCRLFYRADAREPFEKIFIAVRGRLIDKLCEAYSLTENVLVRRIDLRDEFEYILRLLENESRLDRSYPEISLRLHAIMQRVCQKAPAEAKGGGQSSAEQLRVYINNNLESLRSLDELSEFIGLSPSQVIRIFSREFGITPMKYVHIQRIERAEYLMRMTQLTIAQIADRLGFADARHFATVYRKLRGISPNRYRIDFRKRENHMNRSD